MQQHPTGVAAFGATVLIWIAGQAGLEIPPDVAAAIVGLAAAGVSCFTPRNIDAD